jgi:Na+/melibiose symporter-like transporter
VSGAGVFLAGMMLKQVGLREKVPPSQLAPEVPEALVILYLPVFALGTAAAAVMLLFYRIDRAGHEANLARLRARTTPAE